MSLSHVSGHYGYNSDFVSRVTGRINGYFARLTAERQLEALDDRMLHDIGVARPDIRRVVRGR
jgi:uncharacterized protein YjiS (DUF1127 family)